MKFERRSSPGNIEETFEAYQKRILGEIESEVGDENPVKQDYVYKTFISKSRGRGKRRASREVELVGNKITGQHIQIKPGEINGIIDLWAEDALDEQVPKGTDKYQYFLNRLKE